MVAKVDNGQMAQERVSRPISRGSQLGGSQLGGSQFERAQLGEVDEGEGGGQRLGIVEERAKAAERGRAGRDGARSKSTGALPTFSSLLYHSQA